jgi:hypothetical protein
VLEGQVLKLERPLYSHTVCDATSTIVTLPGNATLDNACACASGYHTKISTTANGIVTESCTAHTICGDNTVQSSAGTATADASCACTSGHHSKTGTTTETCEINVCDCPNGNAVANTACTLDGATQCASCTAATHHLVGTSCVAHTICGDNTVQSSAGTATADASCACASGHHSKTGTTTETCEINVCDCPNGNAVANTACTLDGAAQCASCTAATHHLVGTSCVAHTICGDNTVQSSAGTATADASCACASGHHSKTGTTTETCAINVCDCPNGNAVANTACTLDGAAQCASCTAATHHLVGTSCVACNWVDTTAVHQTGSSSQCIGSISDLVQCEIFAAAMGYASVQHWPEGGSTEWPEGCIINGDVAYWQGLTQTSHTEWADNGGYRNDGGFICSTPGTQCSYSALASTGQQIQTDGCGATQVISGCDAGCSWDNTAPPVQTDSQCIGSIRTESECSGAAAELGVSYKMVAPSEFNQGCFIHDGEAYWQPNVQTGSNPSAPGGWGANVFEGYICPSAGLQTCASAGQQHQQSNTCGWRKVSSTASPCGCTDPNAEVDSANSCQCKTGWELVSDSSLCTETPVLLPCNDIIKDITNMKDNGALTQEADNSGYGNNECHFDGNDVFMQTSRCAWESSANFHVGDATDVYVAMQVQTRDGGWWANWEDDDSCKVYLKACTSSGSGCDSSWTPLVYHNDLEETDEGWISHSDKDHNGEDFSSSEWDNLNSNDSNALKTKFPMPNANKRYVRIKSTCETDYNHEEGVMKGIRLRDASQC